MTRPGTPAVSLPQARAQILPGLTGLRGVAAIWVVLFHLDYGLHIPVVQMGYLGVDIFFVMSGFILSQSYPDLGRAGSGYGVFLQARIARIFPMHWAALALCVLALLVVPGLRTEMSERFGVGDLITSALLVQNWGLGRLSPWNAPTWTLSTEWMMSLLLPVFLSGMRHVHRPRLAALVCAGLLLVLWALMLASGNPSFEVAGKAGLARTLFEFLAGCALHRIFVAGVGLGGQASLAAVAVFALGVARPAAVPLAIAAIPALILGAAQAGHPFARVLSHRAVVYLGEISYSIYLLHWILLQAFQRITPDWHEPTWAGLAWLVLYFAVLLGLSALTYAWIEVPARLWLRPARRPAPLP